MDLFERTLRLGMAVALLASLLTAVVGHAQAQHLIKAQPMKMAASEALWHTSSAHASWTLVANINPATQTNRDVIAVPDLLSILAYNRTTGKVTGIDELQQAYVKKYGPGNYVPPVVPTFWSFRVMVAAGSLMVLLSAIGAYLIVKGRHLRARVYLKTMIWATALPFIANATGWVMTEVGRQPWVVFGLERTANGVSPTVSATDVWITLLGFGALYGVMAVAALYLVRGHLRRGLDETRQEGVPDEMRLG